jgi:thiaminase/transcriptional activator TenA
MDAVGGALGAGEQERLAEIFTRMSMLETAFFDAAWTGEATLPADLAARS